MQNTILGAVIFIGFIGLMIGGFYSESYKAVSTTPGVTSYNNDSSFTLVSGGETEIGALPACQFGKDLDIPILGGLIWGAACIGEYTGWLFNFVFIQTNIVWLQLIFVGIGAVIVYAVARLLRGGG